jgi:hypothetical protein
MMLGHQAHACNPARVKGFMTGEKSRADGDNAMPVATGPQLSCNLLLIDGKRVAITSR